MNEKLTAADVWTKSKLKTYTRSIKVVFWIKVKKYNLNQYGPFLYVPK